jgi:hypothetical protein
MMSLDYYLTCKDPEEYVEYDVLVADLPAGIRVVPGAHWTDGRPHVLLSDPCGNTLWLYSDNGTSGMARFDPGEAHFEGYLLQGTVRHFETLFAAAGYTLTEYYSTEPAGDWRRCRFCGESTPGKGGDK